MRRDDEGHRLHHRVLRGGQNHQLPQADFRCREAAAVTRLRAGRLDRGRGAAGVFLG